MHLALCTTRSSPRGSCPPSPSVGVSIQVDKTSWNSRRIYASISITAPVEMVWDALTDYDNLGTFIPSLVENRCLERTGRTAVLYQVRCATSKAMHT